MKKFYCLIAVIICISFTQTYAQARKPTAKPASGLSSQIAAGNKVYTLYCVTCHQLDGGGVQNMNPPLIKTTYVLGEKGKLIKIILNGFNDSVEINGNTYSNVMPSLSILKDQEVADVLTYVRNSFGNKASAVSVTEVKKTRAAR